MVMKNAETRASIEEAEQARDALTAALKKTGITLPSLGIDALSYGNELSFPLIELGRCNIRTARALANALDPNPDKNQHQSRG